MPTETWLVRYRRLLLAKAYPDALAMLRAPLPPETPAPANGAMKRQDGSNDVARDEPPLTPPGGG